MLLPDINVWLALTFDSHVHHPIAKSWFDDLSDEVCLFCRITQQGFLRLSSNAAVFGQSALTLREAWRTYDLLSSDPRISYIGEPPGLEQLWRTHTERRSYSPKVWNDAYLAAFAEAGNLGIVTFDRSFSQYRLAACQILS